MVDYSKDYKELMTRAAEVYDGLAMLYSSSGTENADFVRNAGEADVYRKAALQRSARSQQVVTAEDTSPFIVGTAHYLDSHWADYTTFPVASPNGKEYPATDVEKRQKLLELHSQLQAVIDGIGQIYNAVRTP